jgi:hypothetical protein
VIGLVGAVILAGLALLFHLMDPLWVGILALFLISRAIAGWQYSKALLQEEQAKRAAPLVPTIPESERPAL